MKELGARRSGLLVGPTELHMLDPVAAKGLELE